jgi:CHASE3 domain sensor protein
MRQARRWLRWLFLLVPLLLLPLLWTTLRLSSDLRAVDRTHETMDLIIAARAAARQSREALHAYLQTANPMLVASYRQAAETAWREAWRFKELTFDNPRQVANAQRFEQRLGETFKLGDELLAEKEAGNPRPLTARVAAEESINDGLRDAVSAVVEEERRQLAAREQALAITVRELQIIAALFALGLLFVGYRCWRKLDAVLAATPGR